MFIDTDRGRRGPEFVFYAGIFRGSDYVLMHAKRWRGTGRPLDCSHDLDLRYAKDVSHFTIGQGCLDRPDRLRVAVKVTAERRRSGEFVSDWLHGRRDFTHWVHRR